MKKLGLIILSFVLLSGTNLSLVSCSQFTPENKAKLKKQLCPKLNDCKLDDKNQEKLDKLKKKT